MSSKSFSENDTARDKTPLPHCEPPKEEIIYERRSRWQPYFYPTIFRLITTRGVRNYKPEIKERDKLVLVEIEQAQKCPDCGKVSMFKNRLAYSYPDQEKQWEAVFDAKVMVSEKKKQAMKFKQFIEKKLEQLEIDDIYKGRE